MPKRIEPLTAVAVSTAKPRRSPYKLRDGQGMYLLVEPSGSKTWRLDYRRPFSGKRNTLSLGIYPEVPLKLAREKRQDARTALANGIDPGEQRKSEKRAGAETFESIAREWFARMSSRWVSSHATKVIRRLERDIFPRIGSQPIADIAAPDVLFALRRIEARGALETAHRACQNCGQVMRYAVATGRCDSDVTRDLRGALAPWRPEHYPSITEPDAVGELLRAIDGFTGTYQVAALLKLLPLVFTRPGEIRLAEWSEFDFDKAEWRVPASRMKLRKEHIVPLSDQVIQILKNDLQPLSGFRRHLFPGARDPQRPLSDAAVNAGLRRLGYDKNTMTAHGFRAMARTLLDEVLGVRVEIIEQQLAHSVSDPLGRAYNRTTHLGQRRRMMQEWADYLDRLKTVSSNVVCMSA